MRDGGTRHHLTGPVLNSHRRLYHRAQSGQATVDGLTVIVEQRDREKLPW
jgi:hypothetical protein